MFLLPFFFLNNLFTFILYTLVFCLQVCLYAGIRFSGTGVTDSYELSSGCWELNLGPVTGSKYFVYRAISPASRNRDFFLEAAKTVLAMNEVKPTIVNLLPGALDLENL